MARENITYWVPTLIVSALFAAIYAIHPMYMDDLWYTAYIRAYKEAGDPHYIWDGFTETVYQHFLYDNNRLGNITAPLFLLLPNVVQGLFLGTCVFFSIYFAAAIAKCRKGCLGYAFLVFGITFMLPWNDRMFVRDFALNYLTSGTLALMLSWLLLSGRLRRWSWALILGIVCGWMHEIFAATLAGMILGLMVFRKECRKPTWYAVLCGLVIAFCYLMFIVPATGVRYEDLWTNPYFRLSGLKTLGGIVYTVPLLLFLLLAFFYKLKIGKADTVLLAMLFASLTGLLLFRIVMSGARTSWPMILFSITGASYCIRCLFRENILTRAASVLMWLCVYVHLCIALPWTWRMHSENRDIARSVEYPDSIFYVKVTNPIDAPAYLLGKPNMALPLWDQRFYENVIPEELKDFAPNDAEIVNAYESLYCYKGWYIIEDHEIDPKAYYYALVNFGNKSKEAIVNVRSFTNIHGSYVLVVPLNVRFETAMHPITGIRIADNKTYNGFDDGNK